MYHLLKEPRDVSVLGCWRAYAGSYSLVVGYTKLGSVILFNPDSVGYLVLHPWISGNNAKNYGQFQSLNEFENTILKDPGFETACLGHLSTDDVQTIEASVGLLDTEECYYPSPDPAIGGTGALESYRKGPVWVAVDIAGQNRGL